MNFSDNLVINIQSSAVINQIISHETLRVRAACSRVSESLGHNLFIWNSPLGLRKFEDGLWAERDDINAEQPHEVLDWLLEYSHDKDRNGFILLLEDFHHYLTNMDHALSIRLRAFAIAIATHEISGCSIVLSQPIPLLPPELEKNVQVLELPLPDVEDLFKNMRQVKQRYELDDRDYQESPSLIEAALGLSASEAQLAFSKYGYTYLNYVAKRVSSLRFYLYLRFLIFHRLCFSI